MNRARAAVVVGLVSASCAACAPSLATLQPAHVAAKGHFMGTAGFEVGVPTGTLSTVIDAGNTLAKASETRMLTPDEQRQIFEAGVTLVASPPAAGQHLMLAYTPIDRLEVNLRNAGGGWRLGTRYQLLKHEDGPFDLTIGIGGARSTYTIPVPDFIPFLEVDDFTRYTFDVPLLIGTSRSFFRAWLGPRFLYSRFSTAMRLALPGTSVDLASFKGSTIYLGGQGGLAVGYQKLFFGIELTVTQAFGSASVTAPPTMTTIPPFDYDGLVVYPALGIMGEI